jgi:hypothetical protein
VRGIADREDTCLRNSHGIQPHGESPAADGPGFVCVLTAD